MAEFKRIINVVPLTRLNLDSPQIFTYLVPLELQDQLRPGQLVKIPFGKRKILGVTSSFEMHRLKGEIKGFKALLALHDATPVLSEKNLSLASWLADYYVCSLGLVIKAMLPKPVKTPKAPLLTGYERYNPDFVLTEHQRLAVSQILSHLAKSRTFLLFGPPGSGKTEVYLQIIKRVLGQNKQVIMLVPEISLTSEVVEVFTRRFGIEHIALLHSRLRDSQRLWMWQQIREQKKQIVIGPRSAIFAPVQDLGLVILDEEHDSSYKQFDQNPRYDSRRVAQELSSLWQCPLILGDATPSVESYYQAGLGQISLLALPYRIKADLSLRAARIVDMRKEIAARNFSVFSEFLKLSILEALRKKRQIILFLNRRGSATTVFCRDCGLVLSCRVCAANLVWHEASKSLLCHHCGKKYQIPVVCQNCKSPGLKHVGIGTEKVEEELLKFLTEEFKGKPLPTIRRLDRDLAKQDQTNAQIYEDWVEGKIQILIGTQSVSKGFESAAVGLVGVISADTILHLPDFRSNERTFQILSQLVGRGTTGRNQGLVIIQTYHPENYAILAGKTQNYESFFKAEIRERRRFAYPPFSRLVKLLISDKQAARGAEQAAAIFHQLVGRQTPGVKVLGPVPAFIPRLRGQYRFQIVLKLESGRPIDLNRLLQDLPTSVEIDVEPISLL